MILVPGPLSGLVLDSLISLDGETLFSMSKDPIVSRTLQAAITSRTASIITVRKLVQHFYGHMGEMALDKAASHVVDCIWEGTHGLAFIRERIAEELNENEAQLRESPCGRSLEKLENGHVQTQTCRLGATEQEQGFQRRFPELLRT
jgi:nucleolar protein 9